jgi:hypothetical protein
MWDEDGGQENPLYRVTDCTWRSVEKVYHDFKWLSHFFAKYHYTAQYSAVEATAENTIRINENDPILGPGNSIPLCPRSVRASG